MSQKKILVVDDDPGCQRLVGVSSMVAGPLDISPFLAPSAYIVQKSGLLE